MIEIGNLLGVLDEERRKLLIAEPACQEAESLILANMARLVASSITIPTKRSIVSLPNSSKLVLATVIEKKKPYGLPTALVIQSPEPKLEGMILSSQRLFVRTPLRPYYANARYRVFSHIEQELKTNLNTLNLDFPDSKEIALNTLLSLLGSGRARVGKRFKGNIQTFSNWLDYAHPRIVQNNWG